MEDSASSRSRDHASAADGGALVAKVLAARQVETLFTLCGGHISPILVAARRSGIRVVDGRDEATAVFAADATARLTGRPAVAAVTAGPGLTNSITALKNAQLADSPVVLLGGATATLLRGRGALQDIDQMALIGPHVKWARRARRVRDIEPLLEAAFVAAESGVPGPVFLELPVDILYPEAAVRPLYAGAMKRGAGFVDRWRRAWIEHHLRRLFLPPLPGLAVAPGAHRVIVPLDASRVSRAAALVAASRRPVVLAGSQAVSLPAEIPAVVAALERLGAPVYLAGMARGLLGRDHPLQMRHARRQALGEADLIILAGVPCDFRLDYGRHLGRGATVIAAGLDGAELRKNRRPELAVHAHPARFLAALAQAPGIRDAADRAPWVAALRDRDRDRNAEIDRMAAAPAPPLNPLQLCQAVERALGDDSIIVADGGDFAASASYIVRPRRPLSWLDPGPFGTLGVGAGFALGAALSRPGSEVWILYGDGSAGYSLMEIDTFVRHRLAVIAIVANDAAWMQIARDQAVILGDDVGTVLRRSDYHVVAEGWGGRGLLVTGAAELDAALAEARRLAGAGSPVVVNVHLGRTEFRKGSMSL